MLLEKIKKIQGICNNEFNDIISGYIKSAELDLKAIGIAESKIKAQNDELINTAIITYVLSLLDTNNSEMYNSSYILQKDTLRHLNSYLEE